ncbi:MAG TPA: alpha/beta hydrolase [Spirochaetes bacterium]|nr:alpha/beta hydrolase [Spirochaetota bacterium]
MNTIRSDFYSRGTRCAGHFHLPEGTAKPPVVIMAHGFGAQQDFRLPAYARKFSEKGIAAYTFDYRCFGLSDGEPRNLVSPRRHLRDWREAINHVRRSAEIDPGSIALWGSSFSGGHALVAASLDPDVAAVVAQVPFVDGLATLGMFSFSFVIEASFHGLRDLLRAATFRSPHYVPIVAPPDRFGMMNTPESEPGYRAIVPEGSDWRNRCPARIGLTLPLYRPTASAGKLRCPVLMIAAEKDSLVPFEAVRKTAGKIENCDFISLPMGHFDLYRGELFEKTVEIESSFLAKHLMKH